MSGDYRAAFQKAKDGYLAEMKKLADNAARRICDNLLVHGFDNDAGCEKVIREHQPLIAKTILGLLTREIL